VTRPAALLLVLALAAAASAAPAATPESRAQEAVETYTRALDTVDRDARLAAFQQARRLFADVAAAGARSAELYTNLGNAALLSEDLGGAVLSYRRALRLDPAHPRALQNLDHARGLLPSWVPRPEPPGLLDSFFFWHRTLPSSTRALAAALCFAAGALLVAAGIRWNRSALRTAALLPGLVWLGLVGSLAIEALPSDGRAAVVTASEAVARSADSALAPAAEAEPLPGGTEVEIVGGRPPWLRVRLANGRNVWLPESSVTPIAPPTS
jgi:tetratricopeptide (TPR) repeat protein